jgi:two-component system CheB/CheR fusion protein
VLVVDDNHDAGETLARLMELFGHEVTMLEDGAAALAQAEQVRPDVVLLDIGMPGMSGYEVAQRLRELPGADRVCIIAMTGYGSADDRQRSRDSGIDHHLVKPVDFAALQELLAGLTDTGP